MNTPAPAADTAADDATLRQRLAGFLANWDLYKHELGSKVEGSIVAQQIEHLRRAVFTPAKGPAK